MTISDFHQFGAKHTETGALAKALAHLGVVAPHTDKPYGEELLFGLGGGIGFGYFLFEKSGKHPIHLATRIHTKETERPEFLQQIAARIGSPVRTQNSSSASAASTNLRRLLETGQPPIVSVDPTRLPYLGLNSALHTYYCVLAFGIDEGTQRVLLSDRAKEAVSVTEEEFRHARESSWSPKYRTVNVEKPTAEPDIRQAVTDAIRQCCEQMREGLGITNFGLRGLEKWALVMTSSKEKKSWPKIFSHGPNLYEALYSMFVQISGRSGTGNAQRSFYATFLEEAADLLSNPGLRDAAQAYRRADEVWKDLADAHLPGSVPVFAEARRLSLRRMELFESEGLKAFGEIQNIRQRLEQIESDVSSAFPLGFQESRALLSDLRQRILKLREAEAEALRVLESAIGVSPTPAPVTETVEVSAEEALETEPDQVPSESTVREEPVSLRESGVNVLDQG